MTRRSWPTLAFALALCSVAVADSPLDKRRERPVGEVQAGIERGLAWLARHQLPDGSVSADRFTDRCAGAQHCEGPGSVEHTVGVTALSALAMLGYGVVPGRQTPLQDEYRNAPVDMGDSLKRSVDWLCRQQDAEGCFGKQSLPKYIYDHAMATQAVVEALAVTGDPQLRIPAQKGLDFIAAAQNPGKGWRYTKRPGDCDTSVTSWCFMALYLGKVAGLTVPAEALRAAREYIEEVTDPASGKTGYTARENAGCKVVIMGSNEDFTNHETCSAIALLARNILDERLTRDLPAAMPPGEIGEKLLVCDLPVWDLEKKTVDEYYWYYGSLALQQSSKREPKYSQAWNKAAVDALLEGQESDRSRCAFGGWKGDPATGHGRWTFEGGSVYATALGVLTLETPTRYEVFTPVSQLKEAGK